MVPELRTARLVLRAFRPEDLAAFTAFARGDDYRRYLGAEHPAVDEFVANNVGRDGAWVIEHDGVVVGSVFLGDDGELACLLDPAHWNAGIATEAAGAVVDHAFGAPGRDEVWATADAGNIASIRAMARLGMTPAADGTYRRRRDG